MAQTGYTPIQLYYSSTTTNAPLAADLANGELAINITDGKLFYKDNANAVQVIAWKVTPTTAGGTGLTSWTAGDVPYYSTGTTLSKLGIGAAYNQLGVNAGGTAPAWQPSATSVMTAQGDLLYASSANTLAKLAKDTSATRYLSNTGTSNNPAWAQVNLANGVTGTLPVANGGTGNTTGAATAVTSNATSGLMQIVGPAAASTRVMTIPDANFTAARTDAGQTFTGNNQINGKVAVNSSTAATAALHLTGGQRMLTYSATAAASSSATITIARSDFNTTNIQGSMLVIAGGYGNSVSGNVLGLWIVGGLLFFNDPTVYTATAITNTVTAGGSMAFAQSGVDYTVTLTNTDATQPKTFRVSVIVNG